MLQLMLFLVGVSTGLSPYMRTFETKMVCLYIYIYYIIYIYIILIGNMS